MAERNHRGFISIANVQRSYALDDAGKRNLRVLDSISLDIEKGSFVTFFGPNGCGKTTLLNVIAGLTKQDRGIVQISGRPPNHAKIGYIFQNYDDSLFPWKKAIDNIAYPMEVSGMRRLERRKKARNLVEKLEVELPLERYPYQLSGGQKQLVAIARALAYDADVLLMDEPFAALDYQTRFSLQDILLSIWEAFNITILFVSHEIDEAIYLADRVVLLSKKPCRVVEVLENCMPRPRNHEMTSSKYFIELRKEAISIFKRVVA